MISVAALKAHLNIPHTLHDTYLADLEAAAVEVAEQHFGYLGAAEEVTEYVRGTGIADLYLSDPAAATPVPTVTAAQYPGDAGDAATDFVARGNRLVRTAGGVWSRGYEYAVTYTRGYAPGAQPERAHHAVRMLVAHWYASRTPVSDANASKMPHTLDELLPIRPVVA